MDRATCGLCKREITLTKAGRLRHHNDPSKTRMDNSRFGVLCEGTAMTVNESETASRRDRSYKAYGGWGRPGKEIFGDSPTGPSS